ncbi:MAG: hypothetical protein WB711_09415 [Terriglobales bacterium]
MNTILDAWNVVLVLTVVLGTGSSQSAVHPLPPPVAAKTIPCAAPEYHSFDFWVGDWDAFDIDNPKTRVAHNRVDRILDGCVLLEDYQSTDGEHGQSFTIYDASRKVWHQTWVTNQGVLLVIEGGMRGGEMVLSGTDRTADGNERYVQGTWKPVSGGVREVAVTSVDGGKTWKPWFDIIFRPASETQR